MCVLSVQKHAGYVPSVDGRRGSLSEVSSDQALMIHVDEPTNNGEAGRREEHTHHHSVTKCFLSGRLLLLY
eukprot:COSAG01_NODE_801_length_13466_cov_585.329693_12_plen_71_part_00